MPAFLCIALCLQKFVYVNTKKYLQTTDNRGKILVSFKRQVAGMRIKPEYQLKNIAGDYVVVATGAEVFDFANSFTLNESGAVLWNVLLVETDEEGLVSALKAEYDVDCEQAKQDVTEFIGFLKERDMLI